jgi:hypothetical protein
LQNRSFAISRLALSILQFYTARMKGDQSIHTETRWQKTPVANLVRHVPSGNYYARIRVRGKPEQLHRMDRATVAVHL